MKAVDTISASDALFQKAMEEGSSRLLKAMDAEKKGIPHLYAGKFIWGITNSCGGFVQPGSLNSQRMKQYQDRPEPEPLKVVNRDPCHRCGVRADMGCKHRRIA